MKKIILLTLLTFLIGCAEEQIVQPQVKEVEIIPREIDPPNRMFRDFSIKPYAEAWMKEPKDCNGDGVFNYKDYAIFIDRWVEMKKGQR